MDVRKQALDVQNIQRQLEKSGIDASLAQPRESMLMAGLNFLDKGGQAVRGIIDSAFVRGDIFQPDVGLGIERAWQERTSSGDVLGRIGLEPGVGRATAGLALDVLTDPLTWITFGGGAAAKAGGKALTKTGVAAKDALQTGLMAQGVTDFLDVSNKTDDFFRNISEIAGKTKELRSSGGEAANLLKREIADRVAVVAPDLSQLGIDPTGIEELAKQVFKKPSINIGLNIPFLGHLTGGNKSALKEVATGPIIDIAAKPIKSRLAKVSSAVGEIIKPQKIGGEIEIPPQVIELVGNINSFAKSKLDQFGAVIGATPIVGPSAKGVGDILSATKTGFQRIFNRKALTGARPYNLDLELKDGIQAASDAAHRVTLDRFKPFIFATDNAGKLIKNEAGINALREATQIIDSQAMNPLIQLAQDGALEGQDGLLKIVRSSIKGLENIDMTDLRNLSVNMNHDEIFRAGINAVLNSNEYDNLTKDAVRAIMSSFDEMALSERAAGLNTTFLESYIPHRYSNLVKDKSGITTYSPGGIKGAFMKERTYKTFSEAILDRGLIPNLDILALHRDRFRAGRIAIAKQNYFQRMVLENGISLNEYKKLIADAELNPTGPSAQLLNQRGFELPPTLTSEQRALGESVLAAQSKAQRIAGQAMQGKVRSTEDILNDLIPGSTEMAEMSPEAFRAAHGAARDVNAYIHNQLYKFGEIPKDAQIPQKVLGEIAGKVKLGNEEFVVPSQIADAINENLRARDILRSSIGQTAIGKKFLDVIDGANNFNKKLVTLPFAQYWTNNMIGDAFFKYFDGGIAALDPGLQARAFNVLNGRSALRTASGHIIDSPTLKRLMSQYGMDFSASEMRDMIDAAGKIDIDRLIAQEGGNALQNLMSGKIGLAADQAADFMRDNFERFSRASHFIHHLERGSTAVDAARAANEALINYRDLSTVEQSILRRMFFFYGWTSKATKKAIGSMIRQPGDLTSQLHAARALSGVFGGDLEDLDTRDKRLLASQTMLEQMAIPLGKGKDGKTIVGRVSALPINTPLSSFSLQMPNSFKVGELADAAWDSTKRTVQKQFAASNPVINAAAQYVSGKNLYFDKPLSADFLRKVPSFEAAAQKLNAYAFDAIPESVFATIDDGVKKFLGGVPDGKGRIIVRPGAFWTMVNLIPAIGRAISTGNSLVASEIPTLQGLLQTGAGVKIEEQTPERNFLGTYKQRLQELAEEGSLRQRKKNAKEGID